MSDCPRVARSSPSTDPALQILFGLDSGTSTLMVLTGVNKLHEFEGEDAPIKPRYYADSLGDLSILA